MGLYALRRILISIPILLAITAIIFTMLQFTPGDPLDAYIPPDQVISAEQRTLLKQQLGLDKPAPVQYLIWLERALPDTFAGLSTAAVPARSL